MILDNQTLFSDAQAVTASAASTNILNLAPRATGLAFDVGRGVNVPLMIKVTEAFNNLTSLTVSIQTDDNVGFASPTTIATTPAIPLASLLAGYVFPIDFLPRGISEQYLRLYYTVAGTAPTTGKITAGITLSGPQTNNG